jgi:hypothetical protein
MAAPPSARIPPAPPGTLAWTNATGYERNINLVGCPAQFSFLCVTYYLADTTLSYGTPVLFDATRTYAIWSVPASAQTKLPDFNLQNSSWFFVNRAQYNGSFNGLIFKKARSAVTFNSFFPSLVNTDHFLTYGPNGTVGDSGITAITYQPYSPPPFPGDYINMGTDEIIAQPQFCDGADTYAVLWGCREDLVLNAPLNWLPNNLCGSYSVLPSNELSPPNCSGIPILIGDSNPGLFLWYATRTQVLAAHGLPPNSTQSFQGTWVIGYGGLLCDAIGGILTAQTPEVPTPSTWAHSLASAGDFFFTDIDGLHHLPNQSSSVSIGARYVSRSFILPG